MPSDTNPHGDIFGGWLVSQMDLAGSAAATRRARGRVVTVAITGMNFHQPVFVGDEVACYAEVIKVGHTSLTVKIESWACRGVGDEQIAVTDGIFTYVAVDADGKPRPVDPRADMIVSGFFARYFWPMTSRAAIRGPFERMKIEICSRSSGLITAKYGEMSKSRGV